MKILTLRTDKPEAEIGIYDDTIKIDYSMWMAHRILAETLHRKIQQLLVSNKMSIEDIQGIICFQGPGSFTGLRIGLTVANAIAYSMKIPIIAVANENWIESGLEHLLNGENDIQAVPFYGADAHITPQKK